MKKLTNSITLLVATLLISGSIIPVTTFAACEPVKIASWDGCEPTIETMGSKTESGVNSAVVSAYFSNNGADYNTADVPSVYFEYGTDPSLYDSEIVPQKGIGMFNGSQTVGYTLEGLDRNKIYYYRAVLNWVNGVKKGQIKRITWMTKNSITTTSTSTTVAGSTTSTNTNDIQITPSLPSTGIFGVFGSSKSTTTTKDTNQFKNVDEKSGIKLAIDDNTTLVSQGDEVTLKVRYENNSSKSYKNAVVNIYVPEQYTVESTNKGFHDKVDNMVSVSLPDFPAGGFGTAIVIAKATGRPGDLDQAVSQASLKAGSISLKVADVNEYGSEASSGNVLGASVSGASLLPGKLIGWILLLVVLALLVILGRRYFTKKDY